MSVYFAAVGRYFKIGYSANPERRVRNLFKSATRYSAPRDVSVKTARELVAAVPGSTEQEWDAHHALDDFRVFGEWFLDEPEVRDYIRRCVRADRVLTTKVSRPAGSFAWATDPVLAPDHRQDRLAAEAFSALMREHGVTGVPATERSAS